VYMSFCMYNISLFKLLVHNGEAHLSVCEAHLSICEAQ
jgi:hypothetical protein